MVRTSKYAKKPKEHPDFQKKRVKVGKAPKKPDNYTDTSVKFKKLRIVENKLEGLEQAIHCIQNTSTSTKRDGFR